MNRETSIFNTKEKTYKNRNEHAIYIANFILNAEQASILIRNHWYIENKNHHVRDVTLKEDASRIRVNPENYSVLRSFALNILRKNKIDNQYQPIKNNFKPTVFITTCNLGIYREVI